MKNKNKYLLRALAVKSLTRSSVDMSRRASKSTPLKRSKHRFGHPTPNPRPFWPPNIDLGKGKCLDGRGFADRRWGWVGGVGQRRGSADGGSAVGVWEREWKSGELFRFQQKKESYSFSFLRNKERERVIRVERVKYFYFKNFGYFNFSFFGWTCGGTFSTRRITIFDEVSFG